MATSDVEVCNLALQKLGASRIASLTENSTNAEECNAAYEHLRKTELRRYRWNFARKRAVLPASAIAPAFDYAAAYPLPADYLQLRRPAITPLDWQIESHEGQSAILSNDGAPLEIVYTADVTDPTRFDDCFTEMLACRIADHICLKVTGNTSMKQIVMDEYQFARREARRNNAFENMSEEPPEDTWLQVRL